MRDLEPLALADFAAAPFRFEASAQLDADPEAVFVELGDPSQWFPLMRRSVWKTGATSGVGAIREVDVMTFGTFRARMIAWDPDQRVAFTMIGTTSPLVAQMAEDWRLVRLHDGMRLDWHVAATPTTIGRPITPALRAILHLMFARAWRTLERRAGAYPRRRVS